MKSFARNTVTKQSTRRQSQRKTNWDCSVDTQHLKLLFQGTALSFDFFKRFFKFPGNLPPLNLLILTAVDGGPTTTPINPKLSLAIDSQAFQSTGFCISYQFFSLK